MPSWRVSGSRPQERRKRAQQGPATPGDAEAQDQQFRTQYYGMLLADDDSLRSQLGAVPAATP